MKRATRIYLVRQHVQVGDEMIIAAFLNRNHALDLARRRRQETETKNFDVVGVNDGELREDI